MSHSFALILGSGYEQLGLTAVTRSGIKTPYGEPSSPVLTMALGAARIACVVRHGEQHGLAPHEINYRANLWALHQHGVRICIGINTVGAIAPGFLPGELAVPDQIIDYTHGRASTYGGAGAAVRHVEFTEPFAPLVRERIVAAIVACGLRVRSGTYGVTQGPRLETAAEIDRLGRDGCAMVGMTAMPEAVLARELGIDYAICALAVNHAAGRARGGASIAAEIERHTAAGMRALAAVLLRLVQEAL
jgi:5'-methylthioinosine phosphorylase